ncbi:MAG: AsmA family protein, partial [Caulobacterales bacterium]|nr:AsmA family protein [Caulobacterales bacterium]
MRTLLIVLAVIVIALVGAVAVLPQLIPSDVYQRQIEAGAEAALGRDVTVAGPVSVSVLPRIQARAGGVTIANPSGFTDPVFAEVEELRARLALFPLVLQRVEVEEFVLAGPSISLEMLADGR